MEYRVIKNQEIKESNSKKEKIVKIIIAIVVITAFILGIFLLLKYTCTLDKISKPEDIKILILKGGAWSHLVFMVFQFLQVTFIPLPAAITTIAGVYIFGEWQTLVLSLVAVLLGSAFAFYLGRKFGRKMLVWIAGKKDAQVWINKFTNGKYLFFLMMLFPGFPDDILCIAAGATKMTFKFFMITNLITRPIVFAMLVFLGGGNVIPFSGWGIPVWGVLTVIMAFMFYLSIKYSKQIEKYLSKLSKEMNTIEKQNTKEKK